MATTARTLHLARSTLRRPISNCRAATNTISTTTKSTSAVAVRQPFSRQSQRLFQSHARRFDANTENTSSSSSGGSSSSSAIYWALGLVTAAGAGYYAYATGYLTPAAAAEARDKAEHAADKAKGKLKGGSGGGGSASGSGGGGAQKGNKDYQAVYNHVAKLLEERDDYEDGSYGPLLLRLAWHASGTYDKETGTGGSNGATMRFAPEGDHGANAGLKAARDFLEPVKERFPWITYSDLWTLAGVAAIQEMQGPVIPWRPGRADRDVAFCTPDGRLPDGAKEQSHLRAIFGRMGFNDAELVALSGAHALGRCHTDRSGFDGPWTFSPTVLTNEYFRLLLDEQWAWRKWNGPKQYQDTNTKSLMMLPTDMALVRDGELKKHVERFARDEEAFFREFADVIMRLFELGVPFESTAEERIRFRPLLGEEE